MRVTVLAVLYAFGMAPMCVRAQIVADPNAGNHRPTVTRTPSGLPLVQISTPSAAGVSNNQYSQFSVGAGGAVLNNSPTPVRSQLAGWIPGNPNLAANAKVILNQVTGKLPSNLNGPTEVAGQRAEVVIANSSGITCNGCGFINTARGILTTGVPVFGAMGDLEAFRVTGGTVSFNGAGLNASNIDQVDVIARAVRVNANLHANNLNIITGPNQVDPATLATTPVAGAGAPPAVSIDVGELGGMYARKITLVGTESGVGVNDAGTVAAQAGDLNLSIQGKLTVSGHLNGAGNMNLAARDGVQNDGTIYGLQSTTLNAPCDIVNGGTIAGRHHVFVNGRNVSSTGVLGAGIEQSGRVGSAGDLTVIADGNLTATGSNIAGGNATLQGSALDLSGSTTSANGDVKLSARNGDIDLSGGTTSAGQRLDIAARRGTVRNDALSEDRLAQIMAKHIGIHAEGLTNRGGLIEQSGASKTVIRIERALDNAGGTITTNAHDLELHAGSIANADGQIRLAGSGQLTVKADALSNRRGTVSTNGAAALTVTRTLDNTSGSIRTASNDFGMMPHDGHGTGRTQSRSGEDTLSVHAARLINDGGSLLTDDSVTVRAGTVSNRSGRIAAARDASVHARDRIDNGVLDGQGGYIGGSNAHVRAVSGAVDNAGGLIEAATGAARVVARSVVNDSGRIRTLGSAPVTVKAKERLSNRRGTLGSRQDVSLRAASIDNTSGTMAASGGLSIVSRSSLTNDDGVIEALGDVKASAAGALSNVGGKIKALGPAGKLMVRGASVDNTDGVLANAGEGQTTVTATNTIINASPSGVDSAGVIGGNGDVTLNGASLVNTSGAKVSAAGALALNMLGSVTNDGGKLLSARALTLDHPSAALSNIGGLISAENLSLASASLNNTDGQIANSEGSGGTVKIQTGTLTNMNGSIGGGEDLTVAATTLVGDGKIVGGRDATVSLHGDYTNSAANHITANRKLTFSTTGVLTNAGTLSGGDSTELNAAHVVNQPNSVIASGNASGSTTVNAVNGDIHNAGRIDGKTVTTRSNTLTNTGSIIGGTAIVNANSVTNNGAAAIIAATNGVNLWVPGTVNNQNGATIHSLRDLNIAANEARDGNGDLVNQTGTINNLSSTIEASGNLNITADQINNIRQNIRTTTTTSVQTQVMRQLPWWQPGAPGRTVPFMDANTSIMEAYYVNPADIVSITPVVTPDGYTVHRVVVNMPANASAFQWREGGLSYARPGDTRWREHGQQLRIFPTAGQQTLYAYSVKTGQSNPDHVSETGGAWSDIGKYIFGRQLGTISYSSQYGNCVTDCVRLETYAQYTDPMSQFLKSTEKRRAGSGRGSYPVEVERHATMTTTETTLDPTSGAPALLTSGGAMNFRIGTQLNNDNGTVAAGGNLFIDRQPLAGGESHAKITNTSTKLSTTYSFSNRSGYGSPWAAIPTEPAHWVEWTNPSITQDTGIAGGTITSNQAVRINGREISNTSVPAAEGITGLSAQALALGPLAIKGTQTCHPEGSATASAKFTALPPPAPPGATVSGAARMVDGARAAILSPVLPTSGLYKTVDTPEVNYLVQTDPRFTDYATFVSSDYMLELLGIAPAQTQKRLGDGFYETQLVGRQITALTGRRYLPGYASDEQEFKQLMTNGVAVAKQFGLKPGIALTDAQMAALTRDIVWLVNQTVTLPDGTRKTVLVPQVYLAKSDGATLSPTGALIAGDSVSIKGVDIANTGGTLAAEQDLRLDADNDVKNIGGLIAGDNVGIRAGHDIVNESVTSTETADSDTGTSTHTSIAALGQIRAGKNAILVAGNDLDVHGARITAGGDLGLSAAHAIHIDAVQTASDVATQSDAQNTTRQANVNNVGSALAAGGRLGVVSGSDINVTGSTLKSGRDMLVAGAGNVSINGARNRSVHDSHGTNSSGSQSHYLAEETNSASSLASGGNVTVLAGAQVDADGNLTLPAPGSAAERTLTVQGSSIVSGTNGEGTSRVMLGATGDVNLLEAREQVDFAETTHSSSRGFLSRSTSTTRQGFSSDNAVGSLISGDTVAIAAGRDLNVRGSDVVGTNDVMLRAARDVNITTSQSTSTESSHHHASKRGLMGSGGLGLTVGSRSLSQTGRSATVTHNSSTIGSSSGSVTVQAGRDATLTGSHVVARQDVHIEGQNVAVNAAYDTYDETHTQEAKSSGLTVGLGGGLLQAGQTMATQVKSGVAAGDSRLAAVRGLAAAQTLHQNRARLGAVAEALAKGDVSEAASAAGVQLQVSVGSSRSSGSSSTSMSAATGSSIVGGGNVSITATGRTDASGNAIAGTGDLTMTGANVAGANVALAANNDIVLKSAQSTEQSVSTNSASAWMAGLGIGLGKQRSLGFFANGAVGSGHGNGSTVTQQDTTIAAGQRLTIRSGRDTTLAGARAFGAAVKVDVGRNLTMTSEQDTSNYAYRQSNANGGVVIGPANGAGLSVNRTKIDNDYASVNQQTGLFAGEGGFDVHVEGHTQLNGAVIASTAPAEKNNLTTGSFGFTDIKNTMSYSGTSTGMSNSTDGPFGGPHSSQTRDDASGTTRAAVSPATITVKSDLQNGTDSTAGLSRDTENANHAVRNSFDPLKARNDLALAQEFGRVATYATATIAEKLAADNPAFQEGGVGRTAMHSVVAAIGAAISGGDIAGAVGGSLAGDTLQQVAKPFIEQAVSTLPPEMREASRSALNDMVATAGGALGGAIAGGGSRGALAGVSSAMNNELYNRQLHPTETRWIKDNATAYAKQREISVDQAVSELTAQANRQVQDGSPGAWDRDAHEFLKQAHGMLPATGSSGPSYMFYATPDQRANPNMYAEHYPNGVGPNNPSAAEINRSSSEGQASRNVIGGATIAAPVVGALAVGAPIASAVRGAGTLAALGATIDGSRDVVGQYDQTGTVHLGQSLFAAGTGAVLGPIGANLGFGYNVLLGGASAAANTAFVNTLYGENNHLLHAAVAGAMTSSVGYGGGLWMTKKMGEFLPPIVYPKTLNPKVPALLQGRRNPAPKNIGTAAGSLMQGTSALAPSEKSENHDNE